MSSSEVLALSPGWALGELGAAIGHVQTAVEIAKSSGDSRRMVESLGSLAFLHGERGDLETARELAAEAQSMTDTSEIVDTRIYAGLVAGEIQRSSGDLTGARERALDALTAAQAVDNQAYMLRALRLLGQLLIDREEVERGLGILAFVLDHTAARGGDFTSEIINPRVWREASTAADRRVVDAARAWASTEDLETVVAGLDAP